jgi:hypothetical protein
MIPGFVTYKTFIAIKNHFVMDSYNYVRYHGKVSAKVESYLKRKDRLFFERLGAKFASEEELRDHIIGNMVHGATGLSIDPAKVWIGDLTTSNARNRALDFMAKKQALDYFVKKDLTTIAEYSRIRNQSGATSDLPLLLALYYDGSIMPETLIILDKITGGMLFETWSKSSKLAGDPLWEKNKKFLIKYADMAFLGTELDLRKYRIMYKETQNEDAI